MDIDKVVSYEALITVSASMLALLIPVAIFLIERNGDSSDKSFIWDKMVIFSDVIYPKTTLFSILLITIPLIFWNYDNIFTKSLILILFFIGICWMLFFLRSCYFWIISKDIKKVYIKDKGAEFRNFRDIKRLKFLDRLNKRNNISDKSQVEIWKIIWESEEQRVDMDGSELINTFKKYYWEKDRGTRIELLKIFAMYLKVDMSNHYEIQNFIYSQAKEYYSARKIENYEIGYLLKELIKKYTEICYQKNYLSYQFREYFDDFINDASDITVKVFLGDLGLELIEIFRKSPLISDKLEGLVPKTFKHGVVESEIKQKDISELFFKWLRERYDLISKDKIDDRLFANNLLVYMFDNIAPISFFRLTEFSSEMYKTPYFSDNYREESLIDFASKDVKYIQIGTAHSMISGKSDSDISKQLNLELEKEIHSTYDFIYNSNENIYSILKSENEIDKVLEAIETLLKPAPHKQIDQRFESKLKGIRDELKRYKAYIFQD